MDKNIKEIQELYKNKGGKQWRDEKWKGIQDKEVLLYKPYKISTQSSLTQPTFIQDELNNLEKHMKFFHSLAKTKTFSPPSYYKLIWPKEEQDIQFWKELAVIFMKQRHNTETSWNEFPISMYQGGLSHKSYFIAVNIKEQAIIGPNKKIVVTYIIGELVLLN